MLNVEMKYNPYFVTTEMSINGDPISKDNKLSVLTADRLQNWIDKLFPALVDFSRETDINLHFMGTIRDLSDVRSAAESFMASHANCHVGIEETVSEETEETRIQKLKALYEKGKNGPFKDVFNSDAMENAFHRAIDPTFEVNVIATMSSGKSTVVNALLGMDLMPAKNEACTATIATIQDVKGRNYFTAQRFNAEGKSISSVEVATRDLLEQWNSDPETSIIRIEGDIPTVKQTDACSMVFVDTPGPNNSCNSNHQRITLDTINNKPLSMVIYVLNATQLSTDDDCSLLSQVRQAMSAGGRRAQDRFVFIANKIDNFDPEKGESVTRAMDHVRSYLKKNGIENPLVIPASAQLAKLLRKKRQGMELTRSENNDLLCEVDLFLHEPEMNMLKHTRDRLNPECVRRLENKLAEAKNAGDENTIAEILSGIPIVEELLNDFLEKHAIPAKLKDAVDSFNHVLMKSRLAEKINEQLQKSDQELQETNERLNKFINDKNLIKDAKEYRKTVRNMEYKLSDHAASICDGYAVKSEKLIQDIQEKFKGGRAPEFEANRMLHEAMTQCQEFESDLITSLSQTLKDEYTSEIKRMRNDYQNRVEKILDKSFPQNDSLREMQKICLSMPSVDEMIEYHKRTEKVVIGKENVRVGSEVVKTGTKKVKVGTEMVKTGTKRVQVGSHEESDSHWYNPFSWGRKKSIPEYEMQDIFSPKDIYEDRDIYETKDVMEERDVTKDVTYVNLEPVSKRFTQDVRTFALTNLDGFKKQAGENVESAKKTLLSLMDEIDERVEEIYRQLEEAKSDRTKKEELFNENKNKVDWCNQFNEDLHKILDI